MGKFPYETLKAIPFYMTEDPTKRYSYWKTYLGSRQSECIERNGHRRLFGGRLLKPVQQNI